ncbi:taurine ABC transporter, permease protein [Treponema primitia ZAS-2]|uniref:Taurine ABC transporter, permease protein n=1 Tax=Treponema primitia (strain ATCC BAA-887 / DSM 12427 / ZAS-2) TaxID=545694 RepID=F5YJ57_TREPZ|nr:ABC transporter permease [Treponema primitia]AEF85461.1 taurine ABC transporter, permease protein [Treponema primitia ZAS-2]
MKKIIDFLTIKGFVTWALLLAIWQLGAILNPPEFLPGPIQTIIGGAEIVRNGMLAQYVGISFMRIFTGWSLGILAAVPIGLLIGQFATIRRIFEPFINFFRFVPAIGFLTLFLMWFGVGEESKVAIIIYATSFPIIINTIAGVIGINNTTIQVALSQGASPAQIFFTVTIPASIPYIFTGVRLGLSGAIISIVAAEMLAAQKGIGYMIYTSRLYFRTDWIFVGILTLGLTGYISDRLLRLFGRTVLKRFGVTDRK